MMRCSALLLAVGLAGCGGRGDTLTPIQAVAPSIRLDIRYATENNFTHQKLYDKAECLLRPEVAEKLAGVQRDLAAQGLGLKVFDCYRPLAVQRRMWALVADERYVANPAKGSRHNRGAAVDLTLVRADGSEVPMPSPYDDFSERAHRDYNDLPAEAIRNRALLEQAMVRHGFIGLPTEWWHFDDAGWERFALIRD